MIWIHWCDSRWCHLLGRQWLKEQTSNHAKTALAGMDFLIKLDGVFIDISGRDVIGLMACCLQKLVKPFFQEKRRSFACCNKTWSHHAIVLTIGQRHNNKDASSKCEKGIETVSSAELLNPFTSVAAMEHITQADMLEPEKLVSKYYREGNSIQASRHAFIYFSLRKETSFACCFFWMSNTVTKLMVS